MEVHSDEVKLLRAEVECLRAENRALEQTAGSAGIWRASRAGRVLGRDAGAGPFTVTGGVELTGPEKGDLVYGGTGRLVRWETAARVPVAQVGLALSLDGGTNWSPLATLAGNPGEYAWDAPELAEANGQCRLAVELVDAGGRLVARDEGQGLFTIVPRPAP